jgi:hypothetical protein
MRRIWTPDTEVDQLSTMGDRVRRLRNDLKTLKETVEEQKRRNDRELSSDNSRSREERSGSTQRNARNR